MDLELVLCDNQLIGLVHNGSLLYPCRSMYLVVCHSVNSKLCVSLVVGSCGITSSPPVYVCCVVKLSLSLIVDPPPPPFLCMLFFS